ncbi:MAG: flagellar hook protein FlgE [Ignavibacteriae bacterium]|jgi:flagellar hook protein FlgE|nr:flagellar hook-basal body complex protein [Ignavibacteriota bacterium]NOG97144.1 flagellar hook protein FlgE [Ignavibacteriota bacterium]
MALSNSLFSGVSGLRNHQSMMDVIGNNIANVSTIGFKGSRMTFADTFSRFIRTGTNPREGVGGTNSFQIGLGVKTNSIDKNWAQGTFETTGISTDLALEGPGLFVLKSSDQTFYSRAGAFNFDAEGKLVNPQNGAIVQGKVADSEGNIPLGNSLEDIIIDSNLKLPAISTTEVEWAGNLSSDSNITRSEIVAQRGNIDLNAAGPFVTNTSIYNEFGNEYTLQVTYTRTAPNTYDMDWEIQDADGNALAPAQTGTVSPIVFAEDTPGSGNFKLDAASEALFDPTSGTYFGGIQVASENLDFTIDPELVTQNAAVGNLSLSADGDREPNVIGGSITVYDSFGNTHQISLKFTKRADNLWNWSASVPGSSTGDGNPVEVRGSVEFEPDGSLDPTKILPNNPVLAFQPKGGADVVSVDLNFGESFSGLTQTNSTSVLSAINQNGSPSASLSNVYIDQFGFVQGIFDTGDTRNLAQIMVATFNNLNGLIGTGDNMYQAYSNSGIARIGALGDETDTLVQAGVLEQSNVDLSEEFTKMILSQRGFQANARVITTSDELLQEVTNLVR